MSAETADQTAVSLIPQPHGGALLTGGVPGNVGGGRTANAVRATMRQHLDEEVLGQLIDTWRLDKKDTLQVAEFLAKHGLTEPSVPRAKVLALLRSLSDAITDEPTRAAFSQIVAEWETKL